MIRRNAQPEDAFSIDTLTQTSQLTLPRLWWWEEHLEDAAFQVVENDHGLVGALLASPDASPVAWVRLAALQDGLDLGTWLNLCLPPITSALSQQGVHTLAWMDYGGWAGKTLRAIGFTQLTQVITLAKSDRSLPAANGGAASVRLASPDDLDHIPAIDREAFTPAWWTGRDTVHRRAAAASYVAVAETEGDIVGYIESAALKPAVHINRIAVHPAVQGRGIGTLLLGDTLRASWHVGVQRVTLNTQMENVQSQRLYRRFGFEPTGEHVTAYQIRV